MREVVLDICDKGEMIKLPYVLSLNWNFGNIECVLIPKTFFLYYCLWGHLFMTSTKNGKKWPSHLHHPQKWTTYLSFKIMESTVNTWQILRTPLLTPLLCRHHKCIFPFWFFIVWSVTCLNANEILDYMKFNQVIFCQAVKETKQDYISNYISYFLNNFLVSLCQ